MPYSEEQRRSILQANGLNPDEYDIDEATNEAVYVGRKTQSFSPPANPQTVIPKADSPFQTAKKTFIHEAPTAAGSLLGAGTLMAFAGALAPATGGLSLAIPLGAAIVGGIAGGGLTRFGQTKIEEAIADKIQPGYLQDLAASQQANPNAALAGSIATIPLQGFRPGKDLLKLPGGVANLLAGRTPSLAEKAALLNAGANLGIETGTGVATDLITGSDAEQIKKNLLINALTGVIFSTPNKLGRMAGFPEATDAPRTELEAGDIPLIEKQTNDKVQALLNLQKQLTPIEVANNLTSSGTIVERKGAERFVPMKKAEDSAIAIAEAQEQAGYPFQIKKGKKGKIRLAGEAIPEDAEIPTVPRQAAFEEANQGPLSEYQKQQLVRQKDFAKAQLEQAEALRIEQLNAKAELTRQQAAQLQSENAAMALELQQSLGPKFQKETRPQPRITTELGKDIYPDYTGVTEADAVTPSESLSDLELRNLENQVSGNPRERYSDEAQLESDSSFVTEIQKEAYSLIPEGKRPAPNRSFWEVVSNLAGLRKFDIEKANLDGKAGRALIRDAYGKAVIQLDKMGPDTPHHEITHVFINDLLKSKRAGDRAFAQKMLNKVMELPEYAKWAEANKDRLSSVSPEEFLATTQGTYSFVRAMKAGERGWWKNFTSYLKTRFGENATIDDFRRHLAYQMANQGDVKFSVTGEKGSVEDIINNVPQDEIYKRYTQGKERFPAHKKSTIYKLPVDDPEHFNAAVFHPQIRKDPEAIDALYNELVKLNPELKQIDITGEYKGPFSAKHDVVNGVASKIPIDDIKYFVEELKGTGRLETPEKIQRGIDRNDYYFPRNSDETQLPYSELTPRQKHELNLKEQEEYKNKYNIFFGDKISKKLRDAVLYTDRPTPNLEQSERIRQEILSEKDFNNHPELKARIENARTSEDWKKLEAEYNFQKNNVPEFRATRFSDQPELPGLDLKDVAIKSGFAKLKQAVDNPRMARQIEREGFNQANQEGNQPKTTPPEEEYERWSDESTIKPSVGERVTYNGANREIVGETSSDFILKVKTVDNGRILENKIYVPKNQVKFDPTYNGDIDLTLAVLLENSRKFGDREALDLASSIFERDGRTGLATAAKNSATATDFLNQVGYKPYGKPGEIVKYDPLIHEDNVGGMLPGDSAKILSSGFEGKRRTGRALVEPTNQDRFSDQPQIADGGVPIDHPSVYNQIEILANLPVEAKKDPSGKPMTRAFNQLTTKELQFAKSEMLRQINFSKYPKLKEVFEAFDPTKREDWIELLNQLDESGLEPNLDAKVKYVQTSAKPTKEEIFNKPASAPKEPSPFKQELKGDESVLDKTRPDLQDEGTQSLPLGKQQSGMRADVVKYAEPREAGPNEVRLDWEGHDQIFTKPHYNKLVEEAKRRYANRGIANPTQAEINHFLTYGRLPDSAEKPLTTPDTELQQRFDKPKFYSKEEVDKALKEVEQRVYPKVVMRELLHRYNRFNKEAMKAAEAKDFKGYYEWHNKALLTKMQMQHLADVKKIRIPEPSKYKMSDEAQIESAIDLWKQLQEHPLSKRREELFTKRSKIYETPIDSPERNQLKNIEAELDQISKEYFKLPEFEAWMQEYQKKENQKRKDELSTQLKDFTGIKDSPDNVTWGDRLNELSEVPVHGTDIEDLPGILTDGLNAGSALDLTPNKEWASEYGAIVVVPKARKGRRIEHNDFYKSANAAAVERVILNKDAYNSSYFDKKVAELKEQFPNTKIEIREEGNRYSDKSFFPFLTSRIDKIAERHKDNPVAEYVVKKLHSFTGDSDYLIGKYGNKAISSLKELKPDRLQAIAKYAWDMDDHGSSLVLLNAAEKAALDRVRKDLFIGIREEQNKEGLKVKAGRGYRTGGIKEDGYFANMLDTKVAYAWLENTKDAKRYDDLYIKHRIKHGDTEAQAKQALFEYKVALSSARKGQDVEFNALRKAEGKGLPWEITDQNLVSALIRYTRRAAKDLAYFKWIQNDPKMLKALNLKDQYGEYVKDLPEIEPLMSEEVGQAMRSIYGIDYNRNPRIEAWARLAANVVMGFGTALRNVGTLPTHLAAYPGALSKLPAAIARLKETRQRAFEANATKVGYEEMDLAGFYAGNADEIVARLNRVSAFLRKYQGRDLSNKIEGEIAYGVGEELAKDWIIRAKKGDKEAKKMLERFGDIIKDDVTKRDATPEDISRIAKRFTDSVRGTYTEEGLPSWAIEGWAAPFTALSRFSLEKANTVYKDVWLPLKRDGNWRPFLTYTLAAVLNGIAIEQLNELLTNKRGPDPTIKEIAAKGDEADVAAKLIGLMQLSAYAGIVGDMAKMGVNVAKGKFTTYSNPLSFPLYSLVTENLMTNVGQYIQAIQEGEDPIEATSKLVTSIAGQSLQSWRYIDNNFINPDEAKRKEKFRDLRVFEELSGEMPKPITARANPFKDMDYRKFKETEDLQEAAGMMPRLLERIKKKATDENGIVNPEVIKQELRSLKLNNYQTMPNPNTQPKKFKEYMDFIKETQGEEMAAALWEDYKRRNTINRTKAQMVP